jgi:hypothetical protein
MGARVNAPMGIIRAAGIQVAEGLWKAPLASFVLAENWQESSLRKQPPAERKEAAGSESARFAGCKEARRRVPQSE